MRIQSDGEPAELGDNRFHYSHILHLVVDELQDIDFEIVAPSSEGALHHTQ